MFNYAIFLKTLRDSALTILLASLGIVAFVILIVFVMLDMGTEVLEFVSGIPFIKKIFEVTLGINVDGELSINILFAVCFTHGEVLMLTWGSLIAATTRVTAGEIERGTADLLLTLPVSRAEVYFSTTVAWLSMSLILSLCPFVGVFIGSQIFETDEVVEMSRYIAPTVNFFAINVAVASVSSLVSSMTHRRSHAVGIVVGIAFVSMALNFLEPFVEWLSTVRYLGLLNYYRPVDIVRTGEWPIGSIVVLLALGVLFWSIGLAIFQRKDIPTA